MREFFMECKTHGTNLSPWWGSDAWYISPTKGIIGSVLITIPACILGFMMEWINWQWERHHYEPF